jgi:hypothetical protein
MSEHKLTQEARDEVKRIFKKRTRRHMPTAARFRPVPAKARLSTRGDRHPSYYTKKHTPSRLRDIAELT